MGGARTWNLEPAAQAGSWTSGSPCGRAGSLGKSCPGLSVPGSPCSVAGTLSHSCAGIPVLGLARLVDSPSQLTASPFAGQTTHPWGHCRFGALEENVGNSMSDLDSRPSLGWLVANRGGSFTVAWPQSCRPPEGSLSILHQLNCQCCRAGTGRSLSTCKPSVPHPFLCAPSVTPEPAC